MRINCPYCGCRDAAEFSYFGDASLKRPGGDSSEGEAMYDYVYLRTNPAGRHLEHWYHGAGCRGWLTVERDTRSHEVISAQFVETDR
jgi:heterotetrameric sarcosine oxidase delta subunit